MSKQQKEKSKIAQTVHGSRLHTFHVECDRVSQGLSVMIGGIIGIKNLTDESVVLSSHGGRITVSGNALSLNVYEHNMVEIIGRVEGIGFVFGKN